MLTTPLLTLDVRSERDVVRARQRARQIAHLLGFGGQEQTRIATAVSEIARNTFQYAGGGRAEFLVDAAEPPALLARFTDHGPGIPNLQEVLDGRYHSPTGLGLGLLGARRLMDRFEVQLPADGGTVVVLAKHLPASALPLRAGRAAEVARELARRAPRDPVEEVEQQNRELLSALEELRARQADLAQLNRELDETNRGVVALYAELDERAEDLRRASEQKARFLSGMTHELRSPLNSILSLSQMLLDRVDGELTEEQEKQVTFIRKAAEALSELVNDLLDLAKLEAGKLPVRVEEFEVGELFGTLRGMLRPLLAPGSPVQLVFEEAGGLPPLRTDEGKLSQILRNLISNALKFTERGEVRVSARPRGDGQVEFRVADTGIGIPREQQELIFQEFYQVEGPHQRRVKGTGLGLSLTRKLAGLLGGGVSVESRPGAGSTFTVVLPAEYSGPADAPPPLEFNRVVDPAREPVLIIEDNREALLQYEHYLHGTDFQMIPAQTLKEARLALDRFRPAAIVSDVLLGGENTWGLLEELKRAPATRDIPVLVVTVVNNEPKALALGADGFARKPIERGWLVEQLQRLVRRHGAERLLIIDDEEADRYTFKRLLGDKRYTVVEAASGAEGLERAAAERPRAIFLDLNMPGMDGAEVLGRLKADPRTRDIPVIIHTSRPAEEASELLAAGAAAVLSKERASRAAAVGQVREALERAGVRRKE